MSYDLAPLLRRHIDGYYVVRVIVGLLKIGENKEVMVLIDPCLALSDADEQVIHFALNGNKLELRNSGEFRNMTGLRTRAIDQIHLIQVAVGTWEFDTSPSAQRNCLCHPNFYDTSVSHVFIEQCELRFLAGCIAVHLRTNGNLGDFEFPLGMSFNA